VILDLSQVQIIDITEVAYGQALGLRDFDVVDLERLR
jgi:hypothetical protein